MVPSRVIIHCSATKNGEREDIEAIRKFHVETRGWKDIGYHMVIQPDGSVQNGRSLNEQGAGVEGANEGSIHICLIGTDKFTHQQFASLSYKLDSIFLTFNINKWELYAHHDFPSAWTQHKVCPSIATSKLLYWYWMQNDKAISEYCL